MRLLDYIHQGGWGALGRLAAAIDAHVPDVHAWARGKRPVPIHRCIAIERATGGQVTRFDLRPGDAHEIWPEATRERGREAAREGA